MALYPTFVNFDGHINVYKDNVIGILRCWTCGNQIVIKLKGDTSQYNDEELKFKVLRRAQTKHNCPAKEAMWGDKNILKKNFPDFVEGEERLKELEVKRDASKE